MIHDGDKLAIGVSSERQPASFTYNEELAVLPEKFEPMAITIDLKGSIKVFSFYQSGVDYHIEETNISQIVFEARKNKPLFFLFQSERGVIHNAALKLGCKQLLLHITWMM